MAAADSSAPLAPGTLIGDRFRLRRYLGGGAFGQVYLAENLEVEGKRYAIKILRREYSQDPRFIALLKQEASKQARLDHENVVGMYDYFNWSGYVCLLQNFVEGRTLEAMIAEAPNGLELTLALSLMHTILGALEYGHQNGILHCDVKPANVIVDANMRPRVTDFGIARDMGATAGAGGFAAAGTPPYMSPEQIQSPQGFDHRSDVFAAGVMFYEMLSGHLPFEIDQSDPSAPLPQLTQDAPDVRHARADIPADVARIVATALRRDRASRFQSCADFASAIDDYRRRRRWRRTWLPAIGTAAVLSVAGLIGMYHWRSTVRTQIDTDTAKLGVNTRRTIDDSLHTAAVSLEQLCYAQFSYAHTVAAGKLADDAQMRAQFAQKADSLKQSIEHRADEYAASMQHLGNFDQKEVEAELENRAREDTILGQWEQLIRGDSQALHRGGGVTQVDALRGRCPT